MADSGDIEVTEDDIKRELAKLNAATGFVSPTNLVRTRLCCSGPALTSLRAKAKNTPQKTLCRGE